jgi:two-component system, chemotaxis family, protein-glutamate methylesterase/glutaminase
MMKKVRVLIVDDAALVRRMLTDLLHTDPMIEVVGTASDPYIAREKIKRLHPDVLTLDVEMPRMDGLTFLRHLMRLHPLPVVMIASLTEQGADVTLQAMELGAVDFVSKPKIDVAHSLHDYTAEIIAKIKTASTARVLPLQRATATPAEVAPTYTAGAMVRQRRRTAHCKTTECIVAVGASTGGTEALKEVLMHLPPEAPGMVITQHIPEAFSGPFARRMDSVSPLTVCEAQDGQQILPGHAYIAPGHRHLCVARDGAGYMCRLHDGPPVNRHRPSVDVLFRSVAQHAGHNAIGVLLTGMGSDGAHGLKAMHDAGAITVVQDEKTSVVWGMPGQAVKLGGADAVLPLGDIAPTILKLLERSNGRVAC